MTYTTLKALFMAIADAIRGKDGSTEPIVADNFPERISSIETHEIEDALVSREVIETYTNNRIKSVGGYAFYMSNRIKECHFANVETIGEYSFYWAENIQKVSCPELLRIGPSAFENTRGLGSKELIIECRKCGEVYYSAFSNSPIKRFYMRPAIYSSQNITFFIHELAFADSKITHLVLASENGLLCMLIDDNAFNNTPIAQGTGYIYVPRALVDSYKVAENWSTYASQFRALEDYTVDGTITGELDETKI